MSHLNPGLLSAYNSLTDKHLAGYFSNTRIRRHLQRAGLITRSGRIVPDKEYRHKLIQRAHQRHVHECLAQAIFHKVLEMERLHQIEIKRKLEEFARRERVHKIKLERSRRYEEDIIRILSPRPPTGARGFRKQHSGAEGEQSESSESPGSSRPNTAPGKMQRPVRLKPIHCNSNTASLRHSSPFRLLNSSNENEQMFNGTMDKESRKLLTTKENTYGVSPYCLPVINNFVTPVPPVTKRKERGLKDSTSSTTRRRRLRPTTSTSGADVIEEPPLLRSSVHQSRVTVNIVYYGKTVHLTHDLLDLRDEVKVFQQHCGGENLCVYKGKLHEGESFQFISRRHRGFPFSLTFFLNGLQVERLSSCCEFKHRKGSRLGGRHGHFGFVSVEAASPCYKCIIAMGLDKKPSPPPKRVKEAESEESVVNPKETPVKDPERTETSSRTDCESQEQETTIQQSRARADYEEDFEADDEGPAEEEHENKSMSQINKPDHEANEKEMSESEDEEKNEKNSYSSSSNSDSEREVSDEELTNNSREEEQVDPPVKEDQSEKAEDEDEPNPEEAADTEGESGAAAALLDGPGEGTQINICDTGASTEQEDQHEEEIVDENGPEGVGEGSKVEGGEEEKAESVQENVAEAVESEFVDCEKETLNDSRESKDDTVKEKSVTFKEENKVEASPEGDGAAAGCDQDDALESKSDDKTKEDQEKDSDCVKAETNLEKNENPEATEEQEAAEMTEHNQTLEPQEAPAACSEEISAPISAEHKGNTADPVEANTQEIEREAETGELNESSLSELDKKVDEKATLDNVEAERVKAKSSEDGEAPSCDEESSPDRGQQDSTDSCTVSQAEVTAGDSSSSLDGSGDTMVENATDVKEEVHLKEEEAAKADNSGIVQQGTKEETSSTVLEETSKSDPENGHVENENENNEEEMKTDPGEVVEKENETQLKKENENRESKMTEEDENITNSEEDQKSDPNHENQIRDQVNDVTEEKKELMSVEMGNKDDENFNTERKSEANGSQSDQNEITETSPSEDLKESQLKEERENGAQQSEHDKESENENISTLKNKDGEDMSENTEDTEKNKEDQSEDGGHSGAAEETKKTDDNVVESEDTKDDNEGKSADSERSKIDAESGEISPGAEGKSHDVDTEASNEDGKDWKQGEQGEDERKTDEKSKEVKPEEEDEDCSSVRKEDHEQETNVEPDTSREESGQNEDEKDRDINENRDSDLRRNDDTNTDVAATSAPDRLQSQLQDTNDKPHGSTGQTPEQSHPQGDTDHGEGNGGDEMVSKASEEGASVLLKPQEAQDEAEAPEQTFMQSPEVLTSEDNTDMVSNWISMHQRSKFFETFVEPLEDLEGDSSNTEVSERSLKISGRSSNDQNKQNRELENKKEEHSVDTLKLVDKPQESDLEDGIKAMDISQKTANSGHDGESSVKKSQGSKGSLREGTVDHGEDRVEEHVAQDSSGKTEVQSIMGTQNSMVSVKQSEEKAAGDAPSFNRSQTESEKAVSLVSKPRTEEQGLNLQMKDTGETVENMDQQCQEVAEFTMVRSDNGSQAASSYRGLQTKQLDSVGGEPIRDSHQPLSKDRLSSYSVDETLLGHSSYPLLSSARTESLH